MMSVSEWMLPADNHLTVTLHDPISNSVDARVLLFIADPAEEIATPGTVLADFEWPPEEGRAILPTTAEFPLPGPLENPPATRLWREAAPVGALTEADQDQILALLEKLREQMTKSDSAGVVEAFSYKLEDQALAQGKPPERGRESALEMFGWMFEQGPFRSTPLTAANAEFTVVGNGRLVLVKRRMGGEAVALTNPTTERTFSIVPFLARIGGSWRIVR